MHGQFGCARLQAMAASVDAWTRAVDNAGTRAWNAQQAVARRFSASASEAAAARGWSAWAFPCLSVGALGAAAGMGLLVVAILCAMVPFSLGVEGCKLAARRAELLGGRLGNALCQSAVLAAGTLRLMESVAIHGMVGLVSALSLRAVFCGMEDAATRLWTARPDLAPRHARALGVNLFCFQHATSGGGVDDGLDRLRSMGYEVLDDEGLAALANQPSGLWAFVSSGASPWESPAQRVVRLTSVKFMGTTKDETRWLDWVKALGERGSVEEALMTKSMPSSKGSGRL